MSVPSDFSYKVGSFQVYVPQFLADTVVIRPYGEYGMATVGYWTNLGGGYSVNANNYQADPASSPMSDLVYLVQNDLKLLPTVKRVLIALYWYTQNDIGNTTWSTAVGPAIGPEVQSWDWANLPPNYQVGPWNRANAYWLKNNHQVWPTPEDTTLIQGMQYLQSQGYEVGLLPINGLISNQYYYNNGGEWEIDRVNKVWTDTNALAVFLNNYTAFIKHYIDLCSANNFRPWLFSVGSGLRDLMNVPDRTQFPNVITMLQGLVRYCKTQLPHTQTVYFADLDEYFVPYLVRTDPCYLDPFWTTPELDLVGVNWFAPLDLGESVDMATLTLNTLRGEGYDYSLTNFLWRGSPFTDRLISLTTNDFKTGLHQTTINPRTSGPKNIEDWLVFNHYYPRLSGRLAGCTPPAGVCFTDPPSALMCSDIIGQATMISEVTPLSPDSGGIAPAPTLHSAYALLDRESYCFFSFPNQIPDSSQLEFELDFALDALLSQTTENYRIFASSFGLFIDAIKGTMTLQLPQSDGTWQTVPLFTVWAGDIRLVYTAIKISIYVNTAFDQEVAPASGTTFLLPTVNGTAWLGNPPAPYQQPIGYSLWNGRIYYLNFTLGTPIPTPAPILSPPSQASALGFTQLVFDEEFGASPDIGFGTAGHKWNAGLWWESVPPASDFNVNNGILTITGTATSSTNLCTQFHDASGGTYFQGGYFEARMMATDWSAFWLFCADRPTVFGDLILPSDPTTWTNEIDIMETDPGFPNTVFCTLHKNSSGDGGVPDDQNNPDFFPMPNGGSPFGQWHTYGLLWTESAITWYVDDVQVATTPPFPSTWQPVQLVISAQPGGVDGGASNVIPPITQVQWVRVWNTAPITAPPIVSPISNISGGSFYFEDAYNGVRTAWEPIPGKKWLAITGYGSVHGSGADPLTRCQTIQWSGAANIPALYSDAMTVNAAVFWNNYQLWDIQGPYGSDFNPDEIFQAVMLYCATVGLEPAGPQHIASWFFDTRSPSGRLLTMPSTGWQIYNDAYDGELDCSLNGKAAVRSGGINLEYPARLTIDEMLGLSIVPGPTPPIRSILVEPGVPQA